EGPGRHLAIEGRKAVAVRVVAPAGELAIVAQEAGVAAAHAHLLEGSARPEALGELQVASPAVGDVAGRIARDSADDAVTGRGGLQQGGLDLGRGVVETPAVEGPVRRRVAAEVADGERGDRPGGRIGAEKGIRSPGDDLSGLEGVATA